MTTLQLYDGNFRSASLLGTLESAYLSIFCTDGTQTIILEILCKGRIEDNLARFYRTDQTLALRIRKDEKSLFHFSFHPLCSYG